MNCKIIINAIHRGYEISRTVKCYSFVSRISKLGLLATDSLCHANEVLIFHAGISLEQGCQFNSWQQIVVVMTVGIYNDMDVLPASLTVRYLDLSTIH